MRCVCGGVFESSSRQLSPLVVVLLVVVLVVLVLLVLLLLLYFPIIINEHIDVHDAFMILLRVRRNSPYFGIYSYIHFHITLSEDKTSRVNPK